MTTTTGALTYRQYLRLDQLLAQQLPHGAAQGTDELLFIAVHQVHELWFKLLLDDLGTARDLMLAGEPQQARLALRRCREIERTLLSTIELLDTLAPGAFLAFRSVLGGASGAQSAQFHEVELLSGATATHRLDALDWLTPLERARLERRAIEPTLWDGFVSLLAAAGFPVLTVEQRRTALATAARDRRSPELGELAEALLDHDQAWSLWRARHLLVVERQIGRRPGTGGSSGADQLAARSGERLYPELWECRSRL